MSLQDLAICTEKCQELLAVGLICPSTSDYTAATFVAARTDLAREVLSCRMCVDYRGLNKVTAADKYPKPIADETFKQLHSAHIFLTLGLRQGFNQMPIAEEEKNKIVFYGADGLYEWNHMPFGVRNTSAFFLRTMDAALKEVPAAACYIDGVIVFSEDEEANLSDAVGNFRVYLQGSPFTLETDHQPLLWLMQNQALTRMNARWAMKLQEYKFHIKHRPGKMMQHVDGLSRNAPTARPSVGLILLANEAEGQGLSSEEHQRGAVDVWEDA
ncbi:hypothetical protein CLOM_g18582 [Closterium sp. NIES-68]|nr:hypothetical protein CLOM_g18582 [Closterium sp. NIES-68]GJP59108.1 hypothetical protein CLOP_g7657 [Closterium sp. NIES-67]